MASIIDSEDIIMINNIDLDINGYTPRFNFRKCPPKRTYIEMLNDNQETTICSRIDTFKLIDKNLKNVENNIGISNSNNRKILNIFKINNDEFSSINQTKKNFIRRKQEYDEEKEKKFVENYYRIKNAELNKLRFG